MKFHDVILKWIEENKENLTIWTDIKNGKIVSVDLSLPFPDENPDVEKPSSQYADGKKIT